MNKISVQTDNPVAWDSPDHLAPFGTVRDNNTDAAYLSSVLSHFGRNNISVLDLGCAGGQLVTDFIAAGATAVGLEGSTEAAGGAGAKNWKELHNKNLFFCDLTKPYQVSFDGQPAQFDFIHCWEVVEHIAPADLTAFLGYINHHLSDEGVFCCSIALYPSYGIVDGKQIDLHQSLFNPAWWVNTLFESGFELCVDSQWPPMPEKDVPAHRKFDPELKYDSDADEGIVLKQQGLFLGYLFKDAMFRNHDRHKSSVYFCLRKK